MSLVDDFLSQPVVSEPEYTPKTEFDGVSGFIQTGPRKSEVTDADHADILRECGYDPAKVRIVGNPRISRWQRFDGEWLSAYRFHIESTESIPAWDLDELVEVARRANRPEIPDGSTPGDGTVRVLQVGDLQIGKGLASNTPILTTNGWTTHGELQVGMSVYGADGKPKKITKVWETSERELFKLTFGDGTHLICDGQHLWKGSRRYHPRGNKTIWEQREMLINTDDLARMYETSNAKTMAARPFVIDRAQPVQMPEQNLLIDPYLFGVWLGDGSSYDARVSICADDLDILNHFSHGPVRNDAEGKHLVWTTASDTRWRLVEMNMLGNKHVPECYVYASEQQRVALIQGLMDTDGSCSEGGGCEFSNTNKSIIDAFELLLSLQGVEYNIHQSVGVVDGVEKQPYWRIYFRPTFTPFRTARKLERFTDSKARVNMYRSVKSIERIGIGEAQCITVDGGLYLAGRSLKVTHNCENGERGIGDLLARYMRTLDSFVETIEPGQPVLVAHVGDCIEGIVSQGGKNLGYQTPLTVTEMVRVYRRLLMETVTTIAPHTHELVVAAVNGNHDESQRQLNTKPGDGWATESAIAVKDALELAGGYEHVTIVVPPERQGHLTTQVGSTIFTIMHGHQLPRPGGCAGAEKWLKDAAFYQQPAAGAHFVLFGHFHQFQALTSGPRTFLCSNTFDGGSDWFAERNGGAWQQPFATAFTTHGGQLHHLQPI